MKLRIIGIDIESRRKGSDWGSSGFHFRDLICADYRFSEEKTHHFLAFGFTREQLDKWAEPLRASDLVLVAHNGRYDLQGVNATLIGYGLKPLTANVLCDTLKDAPKGYGWIRRDLGSMAMLYNIPAKGSIPNAVWDLAHHGDKKAQAMVKIYNCLDVDVVLDLQKAMVKRGHLGRSKVWKP